MKRKASKQTCDVNRLNISGAEIMKLESMTDDELCQIVAANPVAAEVLMYRWRGAINKATAGDEDMEMYIKKMLPGRFPSYRKLPRAGFYSWLSRCLSGLRADYRRGQQSRVISMDQLERIPVIDVGLFTCDGLPEGLKNIASDISRGMSLVDVKREWGPVVAEAIIGEIKKAVAE